MEGQTISAGTIAGLLESPGRVVPVEVVKAASHTLFVKFPNGPEDCPAQFDGLKLTVDSRELSLGRCEFVPHHAGRRASDAPLVGDGKIIFLDQLYDFGALYRAGSAIELSRRLEQLPVLWSRKENIRRTFREFVAEMVFDLQVYRGLFDEIDRNLSDEPLAVRENVHRVVAATEYTNFCALFDEKLTRLEEVV